MANTLVIRRLIRSVKNTRQITKAMELVSATKMRRTQIQALKTRTYALLAWDMINNLADKVHLKSHPLLRCPARIGSAAIVLISSNRGLAGTFNNQIINKTLEYIGKLRQENPDLVVHVIAVGRKGAEAMMKNQLRVFADFNKVDVNLKINEVLPLANLVIEGFLTEKYDLVTVAYTDFKTTLAQVPRLKQLLPFPRLKSAQRIASSDSLGQTGREADTSPKTRESKNFEYLFEPQADRVLEKLLPRLLEMQLYQAMLESNASEHSARMVAMKNASDAAVDLIYDLTLEYNQQRQAAITKEIAEISAGRMAIA